MKKEFILLLPLILLIASFSPIQVIGFGAENGPEYHDIMIAYCTSNAPQNPHCHVGNFTRNETMGWGPLKVECLQEPIPPHFMPHKTVSCYEGKVEVRSKYGDNQTYSGYCTIVAAGTSMYASCYESGIPPAIGQNFTLDCYSWEIPKPIPGGLGEFGCGVAA